MILASARTRGAHTHAVYTLPRCDRMLIRLQRRVPRARDPVILPSIKRLSASVNIYLRETFKGMEKRIGLFLSMGQFEGRIKSGCGASHGEFLNQVAMLKSQWDGMKSEFEWLPLIMRHF
jgi:hypothetical protein